MIWLITITEVTMTWLTTIELIYFTELSSHQLLPPFSSYLTAI
jgi:hypothetical protein